MEIYITRARRDSFASGEKSVIQYYFVWLIVCGLAASCLSAQQRDLSTCSRVRVSSEIPLITSGIATSDNGVLIAEVFKKRSLHVDRSGRVENWKLAETMLEKSDFDDSSPLWGPFQVHEKDGKQYVLFRQIENMDWHTQPWFKIVEFDQHSENPKRVPMVDYNRMLILDFEPSAGGRGFLLYGKFREVTGDDSAFLYYDTDLDKNITRVYRQIAAVQDDVSNVEHSYYSYLNVRYMTSIDDRLFMLFYKKTGATIGFFDVSQDGTPGELTEVYVPEDFRATHYPDDSFADLSGRDRAAHMLRAIAEKKSLAMGLYSCCNGRLFLLAKRALIKASLALDTDNALGKVEGRWVLIPLDSKTGLEIPNSRFEIPSDAAHLTVIPGDRNWRFFEKDRTDLVGPLKDPLMRTLSMVRVPTQWISQHRSGVDCEQSW